VIETQEQQQKKKEHFMSGFFGIHKTLSPA